MDYVRHALAVSVGAVSAFFVSLPTAFWLLCVLMAADYLTGIIVASMKGKLSSKVGRDGLLRKLLSLILVLVSHGINHIQEIGFDVGAGVAIFLSMNELVSIVENCSRGGVRIPPVLLSAIERLETLTGEWNGVEKRRRSVPVTEDRRRQ